MGSKSRRHLIRRPSTTIIVPPKLSLTCAWCSRPIELHGYVEASVWCGHCDGETLVILKRGKKPDRPFRDGGIVALNENKD